MQQLVKANAGHTHLAHQVGNINSRATGVAPNLDGAVICDHLGEDIQNWLRRKSARSRKRVELQKGSIIVYLSDCLVVDVDQVVGGRVNLEGFIECESRLNDFGGCS